MDRDRFAAHIEANRQRYFDELFTLLRQPSIAAQGIGIDETAAIVARRLEQLGARVQVLRLPGAAPVVFGSIGSGACRREAGTGSPGPRSTAAAVPP